MLKIVETKYGVCEGILSEGGFSLFKGIPYAAPPVGALRWKPPVAPVPWTGIRKCDQWGAASVQRVAFVNRHTSYGKEFYSGGDYPPKMNEDCLYLNIWTPAKSADEKLPVMMWLHGGGVQTGYGHEIEFDGDEYCRRGVILVTVNYRLNVFGYFSHPELGAENEYGASGNYGLMDQIQALKYIRDNIAAFGGDPDNVTVFGQSGGGRSTQAICCSPLSKGLVHHAIVQSAGGIATAAGIRTRQMQEENGLAFMKFANCHNLAELRALPAEELFHRFDKYLLSAKSFPEQNRMGFNICTDGYALPYSMEESLVLGKQHNIDYMLGTVSDDERMGHMMASLCGWAEMQHIHQLKPAYLYCFTRELPQKWYNFGALKGAFHSSELWYMFGTMKRCWRPMTDRDHQLSSTMLDYWSNFAKTGDPNGGRLPVWERYSKTQKRHMHLDIDHVGMVDYHAQKNLSQQINELLDRIDTPKD